MGRFSRLTRLARLGARLGVEVSTAAGAGLASADIASRLHRDAADAMRQALGELKGLPMKLGQMLSYVDDAVPAELRPLYREALQELQRSSRPVAWPALAKVVEEELGAPVAELFAELDPTPLAAASIGQVHRGRLPDGRAVAVKVQYPGIADAIRADLATAELAKKAMAVALLGRVDVEQTMRDLRDRVLEELDYECERCNHDEFAALWRGDPEVWIPAVVGERCGPRVLVTELVAGRTFQEMLATTTQAERDRYARIMFRFVFRSFYVFHAFNADPHPGNYLFPPDGRVAFLDFGCVQRFAPATVEAIARARRLVQEGVRGPPLRAAMAAAYGIDEAWLDDGLWRVAEDYLALAFEPITKDGFRFDRTFTERLAAASVKGGLVGVRKAVTAGVREGKAPGLAWLGRIQVGFMSILAMLDAQGPWRELLAAIDAEREAGRLALSP